MITSEYALLILGMGAVTYLPRWLPLHYLSRKRPPRWFVEWLELIPAAILSALLLPELVTQGDPRQLDFFQIKLIVALPTFAFAYWTRSLGGTVVVGMLLYWGAGKLPIF